MKSTATRILAALYVFALILAAAPSQAAEGASPAAAPQQSTASADTEAKNSFYGQPMVTVVQPTPAPIVVSPVQTQPAPVPSIALRYKIMLVNSSCSIQQVTEQYQFRTGDRMRLVLESNIDGYLYIFLKGASSRGTQLFPDPRINNGSNFIKARVEYSIPPNVGPDAGWLRFDANVGKEEIMLFLSPNQIGNLVGAAPAQPQAMLTPDGWNYVASAVRQVEEKPGMRDLFYESAGFAGETGFGQPSVGYVSTSSPVLIHNMVINHIP
ncbi:MAG: hypothetical protein BWZ10_01939 [candidate division BRC1 bacterium ADurb.BinA364]|nr:MAG: hypothetical protein BWZ10_01939 [candidate division BRC1 bacterium ADurb.BinA364]